MNILDVLCENARRRVEEYKKITPPDEVKSVALSLKKEDFPFERALKKPGISFICECKKASPSRGIIAENFPYLDIAKEYERAGADCLSVLTEPKYFLGKDEYLIKIAANVAIPALRKDFTVDEYMLYQAKILGAKAALLICSVLDESDIKKYIGICDDLGISALVEAHDEREIKTAINCGARMIGVNNRNLKDFSVDSSNSLKLRDSVPENIIFVSESGIKTRDDIVKAEQSGVDAVLIGETLMKSPDKAETMKILRGER